METVSNTKILFDDICNIEKDSFLYDFSYGESGFLIWPLIRHRVLGKAFSNGLGLGSFLPTVLMQKIPFLKHNILRTAWFAPKSDIIIFGSDITNIKLDGKFYNRISECFANEFNRDTILVESASGYSYKSNRSYSRVYTRESISLSCKIFKSKTSPVDRSELARFENLIQRELGNYLSAEDILSISGLILSYEKRINSLIKSYTYFLRNKKPKIIFVEDGCYGGENAILIFCAKSLDIPVAEFQHGTINKAHVAYNYPYYNLKYDNYLPDYFLSYGQYWIDNVRLPIRKVPIGNPFLSIIRDKPLPSKNKTVLYISSAINVEATIRDVLELNSFFKSKSWNIIFRPHPNEIPHIDVVYKDLLNENIVIDREVLYISLASARMVIAKDGLSTVMFESMIFNCIPVFYNESTLDREEFPFFRFADNLHQIEYLLKENKPSFNKKMISYIWEDNWKLNYNRFIESIT